jgi:hypothetical protein
MPVMKILKKLFSRHRTPDANLARPLHALHQESTVAESPFRKLSQLATGPAANAQPVFAYGDEDLFVLNQYERASVATVALYFYRDRVLIVRNPADKGLSLMLRYGSAKEGWQPIVGDWNNDGVPTVGFYSASDASFSLWNSLDGGRPDVLFPFGVADAGWLPLSGDWDGDGVDTVGLYDPKTSLFYLKNRLEGGSADALFPFGVADAGWIPLSGDWDGDGVDTVGLYDPATGTFYLKNKLEGGRADREFQLIANGRNCIPLVGDWDEDGVDTVGLYVPSTGTFHLTNNPAGGKAETVFRFGPRPIRGKCLPFGLQWTHFREK